MARREGRTLLLGLIGLACLAGACAHRPDPRAPEPGLYAEIIALYTGPLDHLAAVRPGSCPMHPSCSQYSRQAVDRFGFAKGWVMTMDRLLRCGRDETRLGPRILIEGQWKIYDPLEYNDVWPADRAHPPDLPAPTGFYH